MTPTTAKATTMLEALRQRVIVEGQAPAIARLIGFEVESIDEGRAVIIFEAGPQHANPMGTLHGGVLCDVADAAMGTAYASTLGADDSFTTLELKINFLRPVWSGRLRAVGTVVNGGRRVGLAACSIEDERGRLIAQASSTCMALRGEDANGRRPGDDAQMASAAS